MVDVLNDVDVDVGGIVVVVLDVIVDVVVVGSVVVVGLRTVNSTLSLTCPKFASAMWSPGNPTRYVNILEIS